MSGVSLQRRARRLKLAAVVLIVGGDFAALVVYLQLAESEDGQIVRFAIFAGIAAVAWRIPRDIGWLPILLSPLGLASIGWGLSWGTLEYPEAWPMYVTYVGVPFVAGIVLVAAGQLSNAARKSARTTHSGGGTSSARPA